MLWVLFRLISNHLFAPCVRVGSGVATKRRSHSLGEQLEGHELVNSGYTLHFAQVCMTSVPMSTTQGAHGCGRRVESCRND